MPFSSEEIAITSERMCLTSEEIRIIGEEMPQTSESIVLIGERMAINGEIKMPSDLRPACGLNVDKNRRLSCRFRQRASQVAPRL